MEQAQLPTADLFWSKVEKTSTCWNWTGCLRSNGYGVFESKNGIFARNYRVHRISYELANGPIPAGLLILHRCDNRKCVNPAHLYAGTHRDNARDAVSRGRWPSGSEHANAKITRKQLDEIPNLLAAHVSHRKIARMFGVSASAIDHVCWRIRKAAAQ